MESKTQENGGLTRRKTTQYVKLCPKEERNASLKKVSIILQKAENERTVDEQQILCKYSEIVVDLKQRWQRRDEAKRRTEEIEEPFEVLDEKCKILAQALSQSEHLIVYTGAGISTAARIPDYRGTNGIWTRLQQGKDIGTHDLSLAEPTFTHMALSQLYRKQLLKYVVSQNCDGLHLRSGLPRAALSELHGNMYIEVCKNCKPVREYWRLFDVTENTARYSHKTMRRCYICNKELLDTIVHFGERGTLQWPLNWNGACKNADNADTILCLGSSLKVLKRYPWLWQMNKPAKKRPNLYIVNLQWTPKDDCAVMKIHGKCDEVMRRVMKLLAVETPYYKREKDPIFAHASFLCELEMHTTTQPTLKSIEMDEEVKPEIGDIKKEILDVKEEIVVKNENKNNIEFIEIKSEIEEKEIVKIKNNVSDPLLAPIAREQAEAYDLTIKKNCDNTINIIPTKNKLEINKSLTCVSNSSGFSIDSILNNKGANQSFSVNNIITQSPVSHLPDNANLQSLMAYYEIAHRVVQNQMINYLIPGLYPFQTCVFYPGLHSIINPMPFHNYDFESATSDSICNTNKLTIDQQEQRIIDVTKQHQDHQQPKTPACDFCFKINESFVCLYYTQSSPTFQKQLYRFSKKENLNKELVCVCCDYTTEEDSESDEEVKKKRGKIEGESDFNDEEKQPEINNTKTAAKIQAGWFGKGCRKNRKARKKQVSR